MPESDTEFTVRAYCNNDACEFKDMRVELGPNTPMPKCPECAAQMSTSRTRRPQRESQTY